jgi:hypothetical protein
MFDGDDVKTDVCQGCEKGCMLTSSIHYKWHGFRVATPSVNGWPVTSYKDEKKVLQSSEVYLPKDRELTEEEKTKAHEETLQTARKIASILCTKYKTL